MMKPAQHNHPFTAAHVRRAASHRRERGTQLVEVVLAMPVLLLLLAATAELGRYFYTYSVLARATRIAARYQASNLLTSGEQTKAKNLAVCGLTTACGSSVVPGLTTTNVVIAPPPPTGTTTPLPDTVTVSISGYTYQPIFNLGNWTGVAWTSVAVTPSTTMRYLLKN